MKIAILTQPLCNNYGGILQNFALQVILRRLGHTVETLNMPVPDVQYSAMRLCMSSCKRFLKKYLFRDPSILYINPLKQHRESIEGAMRHKRFIAENIVSRRVDVPISPNLCNENQYDAYIVGSDQVWRPRYNRNLQNLYLDFTSGHNVKRIAYAASFGVDEWELDERATARIKLLAQRFDAISVRERSGIELCDKYLGVEAKPVLDPTMLLTSKDYLEVAGREQCVQRPSEPYIGVYLLDVNRQVVDRIDALSRETSLPVWYLGRMTGEGYPSVEEWLLGIANAEYVITDSFHGTVFSVIFNKRFLSVGNLVRGNARFDSLLSMFDLQHRMVSLDGVNRDAVSEYIEYDRVNDKISHLRQCSVDFLQRNLNTPKL